MALTKDELVQILVKQIGLNGREAHAMIEKLHGEITASSGSGRGGELAGNDEFRRRAMGRPGAADTARGEKLADDARSAAPPRLVAGEAGGKTTRRG